jgi:hypothetical protein
MSRTHKDREKINGWVLQVVKNDDGTFDLILNHKLDRHRIPERGLPEELCVRFGFCGAEYESILREVHENGRVEVRFG